MFPAIEVSSLTKSYGCIQALKEVSFSISKGEIVGFLGPNGAGKSTCLRLISGYLKADSGCVKLQGFDIAEDTIEAQKCLGYLPESIMEYPDVLVEEFLLMVAKVQAVADPKEALQAVLQLTDAQNLQKRLFHTLSKGQKQRVYLAAALIHSPEVLVLDEPTEGLDPNQKQELLESLKTISKHCAILFSTHILEDVAQVCSRCIILNEGEILADWDEKELASKKENLNKEFAKLTKKN